MVWKFGDSPLSETERWAEIVRRLSSLMLQMERPSKIAEDLIAALERAERELAKQAPSDLKPRIGDAKDGEGRVYLDHSRDIGRYNPAFPLYTLEVDEDHASGTVSFPLVYEGPPGIVHGGFLSLFFDQVIQHHNCDVGQAGKTTRLDVRYLAPTPLHEELHFGIVRRLDGKRIESTARLFHAGVECATATMRAVAGDVRSLPAVSPRRQT